MKILTLFLLFTINCDAIQIITPDQEFDANYKIIERIISGHLYIIGFAEMGSGGRAIAIIHSPNCQNDK